MTTGVRIRSFYVICNYNWLELWRVGEKEEVTMTRKAYLGDWMYTKGSRKFGMGDINFSLKHATFVEMCGAFSGCDIGKT